MLFKKKKTDDDLDFDKELGAPFDDKKLDDSFTQKTNDSTFDDFNSNSFGSESLDKLHKQGYNQQPNQIQSTTMDSKEFQIMNSKLDAIKSEMDSLMQHILKLEREINTNKKKPMW